MIRIAIPLVAVTFLPGCLILSNGAAERIATASQNMSDTAVIINQTVEDIQAQADDPNEYNTLREATENLVLATHGVNAAAHTIKAQGVDPNAIAAAGRAAAIPIGAINPAAGAAIAGLAGIAGIWMRKGTKA